jgi:hypothetical protein
MPLISRPSLSVQCHSSTGEVDWTTRPVKVNCVPSTPVVRSTSAETTRPLIALSSEQSQGSFEGERVTTVADGLVGGEAGTTCVAAVMETLPPVAPLASIAICDG